MARRVLLEGYLISSGKVTTCAVAALLHLSSSYRGVVALPSSRVLRTTSSSSFSPSSSVCLASTDDSLKHRFRFLLKGKKKNRVLAVRDSTSSNTTTLRSMASSAASSFTVAQFPCLSDNYGYLIHDENTGETAAIDTPEAAPYRRELEKRGWKLTHIFNTHHHHDHTGANLDLKEKGVKIYGPVAEKNKIPGIDEAVGPGDNVAFGSTEATILDVGGHTRGHIAYHFPTDGVVFVGDSLFSLGCGRMFEGTPDQFWTTLKTLRSLPDDTTVYCAHEYTENNAKFAMSVEPGNAELVARVEDVKAKRSRGEPTVPSKMGDEKKTNPFLRVDVSDEIRKNVGAVDGDSDSAVFAKVRKAKDNFRG